MMRRGSSSSSCDAGSAAGCRRLGSCGRGAAVEPRSRPGRPARRVPRTGSGFGSTSTAAGAAFFAAAFFTGSSESAAGSASLGGRRLLLRRALLLGGLDLLGLLVTGQTITDCATFEPIGLCLDEGARVTSSHPHPLLRTAPSFRRWSFRASWRARARGCFSPKPVQPFVGIGVPEFVPAAVKSLMLVITLSNGIRNASSVEPGTSRLHARAKALRRTAVSKHLIEHSHAPRPGDVRPIVGPSAPSVQRTSCCWGR